MKSSNAVNVMINLTLSLVTITGNVLILLSLRRSSRLHAASKALYCSLAISDLGVGLVVQPAFFIRLVAGPSIPETCEILGVIINVAGVISVGISLQILSAISVDRVLAIRLKMRYKEVVSVFRVRLVLITCWFFSTFHAFSIFFSPAFFSLFQILGIILRIGVSTVSYIIIFHTLRKLQSQVQNSVQSRGRSIAKFLQHKTVQEIRVHCTVGVCVPSSVLHAIYVVPLSPGSLGE